MTKRGDIDGTPAGVAVVTGANRGLGLETSRQLLARGLRVVMAGRDEDATERARRSLGAEGELVPALKGIDRLAWHDAYERGLEVE